MTLGLTEIRTADPLPVISHQVETHRLSPIPCVSFWSEHFQLSASKVLADAKLALKAK